MTQLSKFIRHEPCDSCGSSDARAIYSDGGSYCFSCKTVGKVTDDMAELSPIRRKVEITGVTADIPDRRISQNTCKKYGVTVEYDSQGKISKHIYPYYASDS